MSSATLAISAGLWTEVNAGAQLTGEYLLTTVDPWINAWRQRDKELLAIRKYGNNWDGLGTAAPNPAHIDVALEVLAALKRRDPTSPPVRAALTPSNSISIEWQSKGHFVEAEIIGFNRIEWMDARDGQKAKFWIEKLASDEVSEARGAAWEKTEVGAAVFASGR